MLLKFFSCLIIMLSVAFITLLERKYLGLSQLRLGVNKTSLVGIVQPLLDAIKLLSKELTVPLKSTTFWYFITPLLLLSLSLFLWDSINNTNQHTCSMTLLLLLVLLSLKVISSLLVGWISGSKYSTLGALRVTAVSISFEVNFALMLFSLQIWKNNLSLSSSNLLIMMFILPLWVMMILCDTMRTPFDLGEAESELVSGLNTEHMSTTFVLLFLAEYMTIIFLSILTSYLFFGGSWVGSILIFSFILMSRATYARVKNDILMGIIWWSLLPMMLFIFSFVL